MVLRRYSNKICLIVSTSLQEGHILRCHSSLAGARGVARNWVFEERGKELKGDGCHRPLSSWQRPPLGGLLKYVRTLKWTPIPIGLGFGIVAYQKYHHVQRREHHKLSQLEEDQIKQWELTFYRLIPLRAASRVWGWMNDLELPVWARKPILNFYSRSFGCNIEEAEIEEFDRYRNLGEFFRRGLKPAARKIHPGDCIVSPADGTVVSCGRIKNNIVEQVKGISYSLDSFLGANSWSTVSVPLKITSSEYQKSLLTNPEDNELFHYVVYLAPGDYHRFHSPANWEINFRRHFTGDLLSVQPGIIRWIPGLFTLNERVAYVGQWKHGFFSFTAVGATNVGSIKVYKDEGLRTNCRKLRKGMERECFFSQGPDTGFQFSKGEPFGEFNLGSTIVLIFEAPRHHQFCFQPGDKVQVGEKLVHEAAQAKQQMHGHYATNQKK